MIPQSGPVHFDDNGLIKKEEEEEEKEEEIKGGYVVRQLGQNRVAKTSADVLLISGDRVPETGAIPLCNIAR